MAESPEDKTFKPWRDACWLWPDCDLLFLTTVPCCRPSDRHRFTDVTKLAKGCRLGVVVPAGIAGHVTVMRTQANQRKTLPDASLWALCVFFLMHSCMNCTDLQKCVCVQMRSSTVQKAKSKKDEKSSHKAVFMFNSFACFNLFVLNYLNKIFSNFLLRFCRWFWVNQYFKNRTSRVVKLFDRHWREQNCFVEVFLSWQMSCF